jgi:hypothetical protein
MLMSKITNTIRLVRNLRKGNYEKIAIQQVVARIGENEDCTQHQLPPEENPTDREEQYREIDTDPTHI